jgi:hypothetical protein
MAIAAVASQTDKATAVDLNFSNPVQATNITNLQNIYGAAYSGTKFDFAGVAPNVNATVTATVSGTGYTFQAHVPDYSSTAGEPDGDLGLRYEASQNTSGGLSYKIELWDSTVGNGYTSASIAPELRFLVYDVDGEASQGEYLRFAKNSGLVGYQLGNSPTAAMTYSDQGTSHLFSGRNLNQNENNSSGAGIFYFQNVSSVSFGFEAITRSGATSTSRNGIFSAIDGDLSYLPSFTNVNGGTTLGAASFGAYQSVPEPFTVIGSIIGGTAAFRMRKKLKSTNK